jgi:hypothetical protein
MTFCVPLKIKTAGSNIEELLTVVDIHEDVTIYYHNAVKFPKTPDISLGVIAVGEDEYILEIRIEDSIEEIVEATWGNCEVSVSIDKLDLSCRVTYYPENEQFVVFIGNDTDCECFLSPFGWWDHQKDLVNLMLATATGKLRRG